MITRISEFQAGNETMKNVSYTVYYDSGRKVNYTGRDTLPLTVVTFLTAETTVSETVYINDDYNNCVNKRTVYTAANNNKEEAETMKNAIIRKMPDGTFTASIYDETGACVAEHSDFTTEARAAEYASRYTDTDTDTEEEEEENTMFNNYVEAVTEDAAQYIRDNYTAEEIAEAMTDRDEFAEKLNDDMWIADDVTGNGSGSYTFNSAQAREYVLTDIDTVKEALKEFDTPAETIAEKFLGDDWEYFDVIARCYVLGQAIDAALDIIEAETKAA